LTQKWGEIFWHTKGKCKHEHKTRNLKEIGADNMTTYTMPAETLNLPDELAKMFKGMKVRLMAKKGSVVIEPVDSDAALQRMIGMAKSDGYAVDRFIARKQEEIKLEEEKSKRRLGL
jgi:hypothetical protein